VCGGWYRATCSGLDRSAIEFGGSQNAHPSRTTQRPEQWVQGLFSEGKATRTWR